MRTAFIGGGAMGEAMLSAILDRKLSTPQDISVCDISAERRRCLSEKCGVAVTESSLRAIQNAEIVVLAVKPQNLPAVMTELGGKLRPDQLVLSIIAGARIATLSAALKHDRLVRVMPNTPAQIGEGMSVWTATPSVTERQRSQAKAVLGAMGKEFYVDDEKYLDMATAVSGSGPAYFFYFVEALTAAAVDLGFSRDMAEEMVLQTLYGSAHLIQKSGKTPAELRRMVTSPGGTTAEAIRTFEEGKLFDLVRAAVTAAHEKAGRLGG